LGAEVESENRSSEAPRAKPTNADRSRSSQPSSCNSWGSRQRLPKLLKNKYCAGDKHAKAKSLRPLACSHVSCQTLAHGKLYIRDLECPAYCGLACTSIEHHSCTKIFGKNVRDTQRGVLRSDHCDHARCEKDLHLGNNRKCSQSFHRPLRASQRWQLGIFSTTGTFSGIAFSRFRLSGNNPWICRKHNDGVPCQHTASHCPCLSRRPSGKVHRSNDIAF